MASADEDRVELSGWRRPLLASSVLGDGDGRRTPRDWAVDVLVFLVALAIGGATLAAGWSLHGSFAKAIDPPLGAVALGALWFRRRHPLGVAALVLAISPFSSLAAGASLVVVFNAAIRCSRAGLIAVVIGALASSATFALIYSGHAELAGELVTGLLLMAVAVGWGLFIRARRDLVSSLRERAERVETDGRLRTERARDAERRRIAREMHDVLAHRISLLSLHAGALEHRQDISSAQVASTAGVIRRSAHDALEELRAVIGVLREGTQADLRAPQPTLADLPAVVAEARAAGMHVTADIDLADCGEEAITGRRARAAYRIVQEGLTNARKHAPGAAVRVRATVLEGRIEVEVRSRPSVTIGPATAAAGTGGGLPGAGMGLVGLQERVDLLGGTLHHGTTATGDFVLSATLPPEGSAT